ncbi:hypothetical protein GCM10025771_15610 [Niveibacterium umoris]|uniref:Uncharacterized protein n=1 Tax=Niveibacterium umoris TaxID=1193620 RepID=A0A840BPP5_9RHOO|nr:hypothetical protein [Niveibacterium umoris]MBB4014970.1 hypothetical protein [Niveibacterium umoris]
MATHLIPQEIYLLERYSSPEYFKQMRDAFAMAVQAAEDALDYVMHHLPPGYRKRQRWEQPDITWGTVVLPNFRDTLTILDKAYPQLLAGDPSVLGVAGNVNTAFTGQSRDYPAGWMPEPFLSRWYDGELEASTLASNISFTDHVGWNPGSLSSRYSKDSRGPLAPPPSWPVYRLNPKVRVATGGTAPVDGIYLPDADDSVPAFYWKGSEVVTASIGYDPKTMQNIGEADTVWTLVERVADFGGGTPGASDEISQGVVMRCVAGKPCPHAGWWSTPAKANSRRQFAAGEVMPDLGGDYGATIWQWDLNQG